VLRPGEPAPRLEAQPVSGLPVRVGEGPLAIVFLRSLSGWVAREAVARVTAAFSRFDEAGVRVVAVTRCDLELARDFVPREHVLFPVVVDETGAWFDAFGVGRDRGLLGTLARPTLLPNLAAALGRGRAKPDGGYDQLGAEVLVGADGIVRHARYARSVLELPDVEGLWDAAQR
jgi:peroxiredoxin